MSCTDVELSQAEPAWKGVRSHSIKQPSVRNISNISANIWCEHYLLQEWTDMDVEKFLFWFSGYLLECTCERSFTVFMTEKRSISFVKYVKSDIRGNSKSQVEACMSQICQDRSCDLRQKRTESICSTCTCHSSLPCFQWGCQTPLHHTCRKAETVSGPIWCPTHAASLRWGRCEKTSQFLKQNKFLKSFQNISQL